MRVKSSLGLAVGPANSTHWGQVLVQPNAYGVVEVEDVSGNSQQRGVETLSFLGEHLATQPTSLQAIEDIANRAMHTGIKTLILFVPVGEVVYIVLRGEGSVYIKRKNELASLMHRDGGISGEIKEGDTFLLTSSGFSRTLSREELTGTIDHLLPSDIAEKLTLLLHEKADGEGSVALVYQAMGFEEENIIEENVPKEHVSEEQVIPLHEIRKNSIIHAAVVWFRRTYRRLRSQPRKFRILVTVLLVLIFFGSVAVGVQKQRANTQDQKVMAVISDAQHALDEGTALLDLNPAKGRERLTQARLLLDPLVKTTPKQSVMGQKLFELYGKITDNLTQALHIVKGPLTLYYDVSLLKKGSIATDMALDGDTMAIIDNKSNTVYSLDTTTKNAQVIAGGAAFQGASLVGIYGDSVYVYGENGINAVSIRDKKTMGMVIKKSDSWGVIRSMVAFGGNIYLLDTLKGRIWKYMSQGETGGFSDIHEYLTADTLPDFSRANNMVIDGYVWIATTDGNVLRFAQGTPSNFAIQGLDTPLGKTLLVYTSDSANNMYVLDSDNKRVVVLGKDGMYIAQYPWDDTVMITTFVVSESQHKFFLLAGGKIYARDLK